MEPFELRINTDYVINPDYLNAVRPLSDEEYLSLKEDIKIHGIANPLVVRDETMEVIDGHHRLRIAEELGIEVGYVPIEEAPGKQAAKDPAAYCKWMAVSLNINRRQLSKRDIAAYVMAAADIGERVKDTAAKLGKSPETVKRVRKELGIQNDSKKAGGQARAAQMVSNDTISEALVAIEARIAAFGDPRELTGLARAFYREATKERARIEGDALDQRQAPGQECEQGAWVSAPPAPMATEPTADPSVYRKERGLVTGAMGGFRNMDLVIDAETLVSELEDDEIADFLPGARNLVAYMTTLVQLMEARRKGS